MHLESSPPPAPGLQPVELRYEHSQGLPTLLEQLELSVLLSTYQAAQVVSVCSHRGELRLGFSRFDQAMGLTRTASGIAVGTRDAISSLPANREIAPRIKPEHVIAFLAWGCEQLLESLSHRPRTEVLLESGPCNPRCWLEAGLWRAGVIRAMAWIRSSLGKVPSWLPPPPATTG